MYLRYLDRWKTGNADLEHYGKDPMCFDGWKDLVEAGDQYIEPDGGSEDGEE